MMVKDSDLRLIHASGIRLIISIIAMAVLLAYGIHQISLESNHSFVAGDWLDYGFGQLNMYTLIQVDSGRNLGLQLAGFLANLPQVVLSIIYMFLNGVITSMVLGLEWAEYAHTLRPLRVSNPKPGQRSTYFLQLPYRYGVSLLFLSALLHFLISESIFLARVDVVNYKGEYYSDLNILTCGWSPLAALITILAASLVTIGLVLLGWRRYKTGIPLAGSCSLAIAAACHVPEDTDTTAPMKWGVVEPSSKTELHDFGKLGHCAFSNFNVPLPEDGKMYS